MTTTISLLRRPLFIISNKTKLVQHKFNHSNISNSKCHYSSIANAVGSGHKFSGIELESSNDQLYSTYGLDRDSMPKHIAICLDGNRRWLKSHGRELDYTPFFERNFDFAQLCLKWGVRKGTSFMWGLGNFTKRGEDANDIFLGQFQKLLEDNVENFKRDIVNATRKICEKVRQGIIEAKDINEDMIQKELSIPSTPLPDLFLRTGGEISVGALLYWQVAHTELYFTNTLAPDFAEDVFVDALRSYQQRDRKFGK